MSTASSGPFTGKTEDLEIEWSLQEVPDHSLSIDLRVTNLAGVDVYVLDRMWRLDAASRVVVDAQPFYRFVRDGSLRFLLGAAPLPRRHSVLFRNVPHATLLTPRSSRQRTIKIKEPIKEYSPYFQDAEAKDLSAERVGRVFFLVQYLVADPALKLRSAPEDPDAVDVENPVAALAQAKLLISDARVDLDVLRRTDKFDRITLPGERPEPL
jgi:hypothetical protein